MNLVRPSPLLKTALVADAVIGAGAAALQLAFAGALAVLLKLPAALLFESGLFLVAYVVLLASMARSTRLAAPVVLLVVAGNVGWAVGCIAIAALTAPSGWGFGYLALQALAVLALAWLEYRGLAGSAAAAAPAPAMVR